MNALNLPGWPSGVAVPSRLAEFLTFIHSPNGPGRFGDFEVFDLSDDPLCKLTSRDDEEMFRQFPPVFGFFAREGTGGELAVWIRSDNLQECPVVWFDSEGQYCVIGDNIDDLLRLVAGQWTKEDSWLQGDPEVRAWIEQRGLVPHAPPEARLEPLNLRTLEFRRWFADEQRKIQQRLYPERPLFIDIVPGKQVGVVQLGALETDVNGLLGTPTYASWEKSDSPKVTAFYRGSPYVVRYRRDHRVVEEITIYDGYVKVGLPGGFEPIYATEDDAFRWLQMRDPGTAREFPGLKSAALGLTMKLNAGYGDRGIYIQTNWVEGITVQATTG